MTGAAGGIGRAAAVLFDRLDACLVLSDLTEEGLESTAAELAGEVARPLAVPADVTRSADIDALLSRCHEVHGGLDGVVAAAGTFPESAVAAMSDDDWRQVLAVNLDSVFYLSRAAAPLLADGGAIVNIASVAADRGSKDHAHYAAAKAGVLGMTRSLARELAPRGVRVNAVSPGLIDTDMVRGLLAARGEALRAATPMGRLGTPEEVASAIAFLCSDWAGYVTGETLHVNGGLHMA